jgi:acyl-coenzyme A synthetase/AMP-(fatty) acid ligase
MSFAAGALLTGVPMIAMSDLSGSGVIEAIERYRPTMVAAFASTYAEMSAAAPDPEQLVSVSTWFNTGDSAHGRHVEPLVRAGWRWVDGRRVGGSEFVDGLGSSELGFAQFLHVLTTDSLRSDRCVGTPHVFTEAAVLRPNGSSAAPYEVGLLGVRSPTVTPGYWNDSDMTYRSKLGGFWLSGDLVYRDGEGSFYHMDRAADAFETSTGLAYSLLMEEIILANVREIGDCAVVGVPSGDMHLPVAIVTTLGQEVTPEHLLRRVNAVLALHGQSELAMLEMSETVPLGPTGKVLKRDLRGRYRDVLTALPRVQVAGRAYSREMSQPVKGET